MHIVRTTLRQEYDYLCQYVIGLSCIEIAVEDVRNINSTLCLLYTSDAADE